MNLCQQRCTPRRIAKAVDVGAPLPAVGCMVKDLGIGRLRYLGPKDPVQRYPWEKPASMIHVDTKQRARFERVGHPITGDPCQGWSR